MPELTGTQLAIELRKLNPTLPILIASGYGGAGFETRALSAGVNRVLKKPYRMSEIAEVLAGSSRAADRSSRLTCNATPQTRVTAAVMPARHSGTEPRPAVKSSGAHSNCPASPRTCVRAGNGESRSVGMASPCARHLQPIYSVRQAGCIGLRGAAAGVRRLGPGCARSASSSAPASTGRRGAARLDLPRAAPAQFRHRRPGRPQALPQRPPRGGGARRRARCASSRDLVRYYGLPPSAPRVEILEAPCPDEALLREAVAALSRVSAPASPWTTSASAARTSTASWRCAPTS